MKMKRKMKRKRMGIDVDDDGSPSSVDHYPFLILTLPSLIPPNMELFVFYFFLILRLL